MANQRISIPDQVQAFKKGDFVDIHWLDAATVRDARIETLPLPNDYVETRRRTPGLFVCVQKGKTWRISTLVILRDQTDDYRAEIRVIPIPIVMLVRKTADKTPESVEKVDNLLRSGKLQPGETRFKKLHDGALKVID